MREMARPGRRREQKNGRASRSARESWRQTMAFRILQRLLASSAAVLLLTVTAAEAKDLCINPDIRISRFKQPPPGQCLPVAGTHFEAVNGHYGRVSGDVCTRSDGTALFLGLTVFDVRAVEFYAIDIELPALNYLYDLTQLNGTTVSGLGQAAYCSSIPIP
jgi:hypothetical protein